MDGLIEFLKENLPEETFTPDFIDGIKEHIPQEAPPSEESENTESEKTKSDNPQDIEDAVNKALEENDAKWNKRYRDAFFSTPEADPVQESNQEDESGAAEAPDISDILDHE